MSEADQKFVQYWTEKRKRGKWNYALRHGVLLFAWPVFLFSELFKYLFYGDYVLTTSRIVGGWIIWTILGFFGLRPAAVACHGKTIYETNSCHRNR